MYKGKLNRRNPPHETGPSAKPEKRGGGPPGSGWLVARVPVAWSTITIGPQSDTPHSRPASRAQSIVASSKYRWASCGWTCAFAAAAAPSGTSRNSSLLSWYRIFMGLSAGRRLPQTIGASYVGAFRLWRTIGLDVDSIPLRLTKPSPAPAFVGASHGQLRRGHRSSSRVWSKRSSAHIAFAHASFRT